jgi:HAAS domain-containing protein
MSEPRDLIEEYLSDLRARLELAPQEAEFVVAEAEDHLRETAAYGLTTGMTEHEAQLAAISAFGSVTAVVRAHASRPADFIRGRTPVAILGDLILAGWKLAGTGLIAVGVSGLIALVMNLAFGRAFTGQAPAGVSFGKADCAYWMGLWPGAHGCAAAHMLEASSDAVVLRAGAGVMGAALLVAYGVVRYLQRRRGRGPVVVLGGYFPLLAAAVFSAGALGLALAQITGFTVRQGPGTYLSGAIVAAAAALWYGRKARPAIQRLRSGWARYAGSRA